MKRRGTVRITQAVHIELPWHRFEASWQPKPDHPESFEDGPGWNDVDLAITWARSRAPRIHVRLTTGHFAAGEKDWPRGEARWSGARRRRERLVRDGYGGAVYINEIPAHHWPREVYSAMWESESGAILGSRSMSSSGRGGFRDVEAAIDWGRDRAPVVLVALLEDWGGSAPTYEIWSAGDEDPPGERLPRLRPKPPRDVMEWVYETALPSPHPAGFEDFFEGDTPWRPPNDILKTLRADPRAASPTIVAERHVVRFRVVAPNRTQASDLGRDVFLDSALDQSPEGLVLWVTHDTAVRPYEPRRRSSR